MRSHLILTKLMSFQNSLVESALGSYWFAQSLSFLFTCDNILIFSNSYACLYSSFLFPSDLNKWDFSIF